MRTFGARVDRNAELYGSVLRDASSDCTSFWPTYCCNGALFMPDRCGCCGTGSGCAALVAVAVATVEVSVVSALATEAVVALFDVLT